MWPSKYSYSWNAKDVGPKRDLVGELASAVRNKTNLKFGLYHSLFEWFHPLYLQDKANGYKTQYFVGNKTMPELYELVTTYKPEIVWSDGPMDGKYTYWNSTQFIAWLYNSSPVKDTVVVNDRWGKGLKCKHGDFYTCRDHYNPGHLLPYKWENCDTVDKNSWAFRRNAKLEDYHTIQELLSRFISTVSCGGNFLLNVAPTKYGVITPIYEERFSQLGTWLAINGESIYATTAWTSQRDNITSGVWYTHSIIIHIIIFSLTSLKYTQKKTNSVVYAIVLNWPKNGLLLLGSPTLVPESTITLLGYTGNLQWNETDNGIKIQFPDRDNVKSKWAWALKLTNTTE
uniref:alpha-L-fucosidase n=1 Tax=Timema bartmani TaxID=61472 RepID=A0A7R9F9G1_9NEOP|nr:unnamed protein product [Timema bartmani]